MHSCFREVNGNFAIWKKNNFLAFNGWNKNVNLIYLFSRLKDSEAQQPRFSATSVWLRNYRSFIFLQQICTEMYLCQIRPVSQILLVVKLVSIDSAVCLDSSFCPAVCIHHWAREAPLSLWASGKPSHAAGDTGQTETPAHTWDEKCQDSELQFPSDNASK